MQACTVHGLNQTTLPRQATTERLYVRSTFDGIPSGVGLLQVAGLDLIDLQAHTSFDMLQNIKGAMRVPASDMLDQWWPCTAQDTGHAVWPACFSMAHKVSWSRARFCSASASCCSSTGVLSTFLSMPGGLGVGGPAFAVLFLLLPIDPLLLTVEGAKSGGHG